MIVVLIAIFDLGRLVFAYNDITNAARQGARTAIVNQGGTAALRPSHPDGNVARPGPVQGPGPLTPDSGGGELPRRRAGKYTLACQVNVTVSYDWTPITPVIGNIVGPMTVTATTQMPIERIFP